MDIGLLSTVLTASSATIRLAFITSGLPFVMVVSMS